MQQKSKNIDDLRRVYTTIDRCIISKINQAARLLSKYSFSSKFAILSVDPNSFLTLVVFCWTCSMTSTLWILGRGSGVDALE